VHRRGRADRAREPPAEHALLNRLCAAVEAARLLAKEVGPDDEDEPDDAGGAGGAAPRGRGAAPRAQRPKS
jgi:hypothetical protein